MTDWKKKFEELYEDYDDTLCENSTFRDERNELEELITELKSLKQYKKKNYYDDVMYVKADEAMDIVRRMENLF